MNRLFALLLLVIFGWAGAHELTFSRVDVQLDAAQTRLTVKLPEKALLHEQPSPLPAGTTAQTLSAPTLSAGVRTSLGTLVTARLRLLSGNTSLPLTVNRVEATGEDVTLTLSAPPVSGALGVQANLFPDDALHKVFVSVYRDSALVGQYALDRQNFSLTLAAPARPLTEVIATFVREGVRHIFIGPDHILFVLALILLGGRVGAQVKIITAFTAAHSVTLVLATLGVVQLPSRLVESVIALSIVAVGLHDLRQVRRRAASGRDLRVPLAATFGLIHGFGFASVLRELDLPQAALGWSLAAFNVGVEIGQVAIVLLAAPMLFALRRFASPDFRQGVLMAASLGVVLVGGLWFVQRLTA